MVGICVLHSFLLQIFSLGSVSECRLRLGMLTVIAFLICRISHAEGILHQALRSHEALNRFNRGVQTFDYGAQTNDSTTEMIPASTTTKPLPATYTVVDWQRYYPFGDKFMDKNETTNATTQTPELPKQSVQPMDNQLVYPVYVKVPIRVPLKASFRKPEIPVTPKLVMPRTIRGAKNLAYPGYRYKLPPRYMMVKQMPMRRKFVAYYQKPTFLYKRFPQYVKPVYQKTGIHDLYQKNVYYPLRGFGYAVTEPKLENWYEPGKVNPANNLV